MISSKPRPAPDELYVGYRSVPARHKRFLRLAVPALLWGMCAVAALIVGSLSSAGRGSWNTTDTVVFEGMVSAAPYPAVHVLDASAHGGGRTYILVEPGKVGVRPGLDALAGQAVRVEGFLLQRDDRRMLELLPGIDGIRPLTGVPADRAPPLAPPVARPIGAVTLRGEIVDYKCYLGAMKPGHGMTHRACAALCVSGGIPPTLVVRSAGESDRCFILTGLDGRRVNEGVLPFVAEPVEVEGRLEQFGDLQLLRIDPGSIRRL